MMPPTAKELFQVVIGARESFDVITVKQSRCITAGDFEKVFNARG
jgi:hypothetical protein